MEAFIGGMGLLLDPKILLVVFLGTVIGIVVGALPGISGSTTTALLLPFTITMGPVPAIAFLGAIYCAANFGGSITAILVNSPEDFALAVFGLSMVAMTGGESAVKNLIAGAFGVLLATVGQDITTGVERYTFGIYSFTDGIEFIPVLIGLFALTELLEQASQLAKRTAMARLGAVRLPSWADVRGWLKAISLSSVLGTFIGVLPALGATTAAMIAYVETKRWSRNKEEFGKGAIEGVAGPEAANNAAVGGAMVPTLALGIPGSGTTAIILAGLIVQGVRPGPHLFTEQPTLLYAVFSSMLLANLLYLVLGLGFAKLFARIPLIPPQFLWPAVFVLSVIGAYAPNQAMAEVSVAIAFGFIGFFMRRFGFSPAPLVIGLVLGKLVEETLKQSLIIFDLSWGGFLNRPIALTLFGLTALFLLGPFLLRRRASHPD